jgi:hypothetical protein
MNATETTAANDTKATLRRLVECAERGDHSVLPELRRLLDEHQDLWKEYGDLALLAQRTWLKVIAGNNLALRECLERKPAALKAELGEGGSGPLDGLLVDRIVACWLQVHFSECYLAQIQGKLAAPGQVQFAERFLDRAQSRYLASIRQLATVRKLLRPAPSPLQIATRLGKPAPATTFRREPALAVAAGVEN